MACFIVLIVKECVVIRVRYLTADMSCSVYSQKRKDQSLHQRRDYMRRIATRLPSKVKVLKLQDFIDYSVSHYDELGRVLSKALKDPTIPQQKKRIV